MRGSQESKPPGPKRPIYHWKTQDLKERYIFEFILTFGCHQKNMIGLFFMVLKHVKATFTRNCWSWIWFIGVGLLFESMGDASGAAALIFSKNPPRRKMNIAHLCNLVLIDFHHDWGRFFLAWRKIWPPFFLKRIANDSKNRTHSNPPKKLT